MTAVILYFLAFIVGCIWGHYEQSPFAYICAGFSLGIAWRLLCDLILDKLDS